MEENFNDQFQSPQISAVEVLKIEKRFDGGANWFFWIAALSLVNSLIFLFGGSMNFIIGLGMTQIIDGFTAGIILEATETMQVSSVFITGIKGAGLLLVVGVLSVFVLFGILARKRFQWAFIVGMVIYAMDGLIFLFVGDILSLGFHVFALFGLLGGLQALRKLKSIEEGGFIISAEPIAVQKPPRDRTYWLKLLIPALILLLPLLFFIIMIFSY